MKRLIQVAWVLLMAANAAQAAWWDNRYAVLKADGLATGFAPDLGRSRFESEGLRAGPPEQWGIEIVKPLAGRVGPVARCGLQGGRVM